MKKIEYFGKKTLDTFIISLTYQNNLPSIKLNKIYPFAEAIEDYYPIKPQLALLKRRFTEIRLAPFTFWDENEKNRVEIGQDFLVFTFVDYLKWDRELVKILKVFNALREFLDLPNIIKIVITYVDIFPISREDFVYDEYFTIPKFNFGHDWNIKFHDTNLGFVPFEEEYDECKKKIVIRFKSIPKENNDDYFNFRLETVGSVDNFTMSPDPQILQNFLNDCHDRIEDYFVNFLTETYRRDLELEIIDY